MTAITEMYDFILDGTYYTFTTKLSPVTFNARTYYPTIIKRGNIKITNNFLKNTLSVSFPLTNSFARKLMLINPEAPVTITLYRNNAVYWQGTVISAAGNGLWIDLDCVSSYSLTTRPFGTRKIQILCSNRLYDNNCKVDKEVFKVISAIASVDTTGLILTMTGLTQPDAYFLDGTISINNQSRRILYHVGNIIKVSYGFNTIPSGTAALYPGCDLRETTCTTKFNNLPNHAGFKRLPPVSPYDSNGIL